MDKLPKRAPEAAKDLPRGAESHRLAYTEGNVTWIVEALFRRMSIREQAKTIIHERLHAFAGFVPHGPIIDLTDGIETVLSLYLAQMKGKRPVLSNEQVTTLTKLTRRIADLRLGYTPRHDRDLKRWCRDYFITANGGGLVNKTSTVDPTAYIGVGSIVQESSVIAANVELLNAQFCPVISGDSDYVSEGPYTGTFTVGEGTKLTNSWIGFCSHGAQIGRNVVIENSLIAANPATNPGQHDFVIGDGVTMSNSSLQNQSKLLLGEKSSLQNAHLHFSKANPWYTNVYFEMGDGASIRNLSGSAPVGLVDHKNGNDDPSTALTIVAKLVLDFQGKPLCTGAASRPDYFRGDLNLSAA